MRYLKKWKLFESISDDSLEKLSIVQREYNEKVLQIKKEYLELISECMFDLTDEFDHTSEVNLRIKGILGERHDLVTKFKFDVKIDRVDDFFNILEGLRELINSHVGREFIIDSIEFKTGKIGNLDSTTLLTLLQLNNSHLSDIREKVMSYKESISSRTKSRKSLSKIVIFLTI
jgi:hypothetical protein